MVDIEFTYLLKNNSVSGKNINLATSKVRLK